MADEIKLFGTSGNDYYVVLRSSSNNQIYNTDTPGLETYNESNWGDYAIAVTEQGTSGYFLADMPGSLAAGEYTVEARDGLAASAAVSDNRHGISKFTWNGTEEAPNVLNDLVDGITVKKLLEVLLAALAGETNFVDGDTLQFLNQQGAVVLEVDYGTNAGDRTNSTIS